MAERLIFLAASSLLAGAALAQPLADPTRPSTQAQAQAPAELRQSEPAFSRLQSVLISGGRNVAVIDGRAVRVGERVGDAILVSIEPSEVILQRGSTRERLSLLPGAVEKRPVQP
jgi:MSHA biogenesis protein MshK